METVLRELAILPGVTGSCVIFDNSRILSSSLPELFTPTMAIEAGGNIRRMMQMAAVKGLTPKTMSIRYDRFTVLGTPVNNEAVLIVLCEPGCNTSLVSTTASVLKADLEKKIAQSKSQNEEPQTSSPNKSAKDIDTETEKALEQIKVALFETVGPIADMVYAECTQRWTENSNADMARIFELLACISQEIDNSELFAEFKGRISSLL